MRRARSAIVPTQIPGFSIITTAFPATTAATLARRMQSATEASTTDSFDERGTARSQYRRWEVGGFLVDHLYTTWPMRSREFAMTQSYGDFPSHCHFAQLGSSMVRRPTRNALASVCAC